MSNPLPLPNVELFSVAMPQKLHEEAAAHLLKYYNQGRHQENLCIALWRPSIGTKRVTALVHRLVFAQTAEVQLTGNVSFSGAYLDRVSEIAAREDSGLVLMHNHFGPGWQGMSPDDISTEEMRAKFALSSTGLPLVGMTLGTDEAWSGRFWPRTGPKRYERSSCISVRVFGNAWGMTFHPQLLPVPTFGEQLRRTISAWGEHHQSQIGRIHVGVVGLGSVGRLVIEDLARMGVGQVSVIDFDRLEMLNLDRQLGASVEDAKARKLKVDLARDGFLTGATAARPTVNVCPFAVTEPQGYAAALDCDVIFCCVDRPWGRQVLNHIAYAHLIPVIDGGIIVRTKGGQFRGAEWSVRTVGPGRCCLQCCGQLDPGLVDAERQGLLDNQSYIEGLPADIRAAMSQNVFPFSMSLAAHEVLQFIALITGLLGRSDFGEQRYHYNLGEMLVAQPTCNADCIYQTRLASGESQYPREVMTGSHPKADQVREEYKQWSLSSRVKKRQGIFRRFKDWWDKLGATH